MKITTSKQLYITNLEMNKQHSYTLNQNTQGSLKNSTPFIQALRLTKQFTTTGYGRNCAIIKQKFLDRQYKEEVLDEQIKKVDRIERKELFTNK